MRRRDNKSNPDFIDPEVRESFYALASDLQQEWGRRIVAAREAKQWSQRALAHRLGMTNRAVGNWEMGLDRPRTWTMLYLAELLEVPVEDLFPLDAARAWTDV